MKWSVFAAVPSFNSICGLLLQNYNFDQFQRYLKLFPEFMAGIILVFNIRSYYKIETFSCLDDQCLVCRHLGQILATYISMAHSFFCSF